MKELQEKYDSNQPVDYDDNDLDDGVVGTIPSSRIVKVKDNDNDDYEDDDVDRTDDSNSNTGRAEGQDHKTTKKNTVLAILASALILLPAGGYFVVNSSATMPPVTALKVILHKQSFKDTAPNHVVKMSYLNKGDAPAYIAFYKDGKWALSDKDDFGTNLETISDAEAVKHTGEAVAQQLKRNGVPTNSNAFSQLAQFPGIETTMRYHFSKDGTRVELSIKVTPKKDFKKLHPKDTIKQITSYDYVFANFSNTAKNKFKSDMSTSFNGNIDKTSNKVSLRVIR